MTATFRRTFLLVILLAGSWVAMGWHWYADHAQSHSDQTGPGSTPPQLTSVTAIGELPDEASFGPVPDFVSDLSTPGRDTARFEAESGVRYWLYQLEHDSRGVDPQQYFRIISEPVSTAGIDRVANMTAVYNPAYETLVFHSLRVERDGVIEDRRGSTTIEFARRETRLERRMFDGRATAIIRFSDIRIGDRVEVAYSISGRNPALPDHDSRDFWLGFSTPVEHLLIRSVWPSEDGTHHQIIGPDPGFALETHSDADTYSLSYGPAPTPSTRSERGGVAWIRQAPSFQVSNFQDWAAVSRWSAPYYEPETTVAVTEIAAALQDRYPEPEDQLLAALRFVQDEVRYLAISFGAGGYVPASPDETLERRYGDCKAKTVLLMALLDALGIQSEAALVHTSQGFGLPQTLPRHSAFNHVIVRAHLNGQSYWLDGTRSEQGGRLATMTQPNFGWALPISRAGDTLTAMPATDSETVTVDMSEEITVHDDSGAARVVLEMRANERGADNIRASLSRTGRVDMQESMLDRYRAGFGDLTAASDLSIVDDRDANTIRMRLELEVVSVLSDHEDGSRRRIAGWAPLRQPTDVGSERNRTYPLSIGRPDRQIARVSLILPESMADWDFETGDRALDSPGFSLDIEADRAGNRASLVYELHTRTRMVEAEDANETLDAADQLRRLVTWSLSSP